MFKSVLLMRCFYALLMNKWFMQNQFTLAFHIITVYVVYKAKCILAHVTKEHSIIINMYTTTRSTFDLVI